MEKDEEARRITEERIRLEALETIAISKAEGDGELVELHARLSAVEVAKLKLEEEHSKLSKAFEHERQKLNSGMEKERQKAKVADAKLQKTSDELDRTSLRIMEMEAKLTKVLQHMKTLDAEKMRLENEAGRIAREYKQMEMKMVTCTEKREVAELQAAKSEQEKQRAEEQLTLTAQTVEPLQNSLKIEKAARVKAERLVADQEKRLEDMEARIKVMVQKMKRPDVTMSRLTKELSDAQPYFPLPQVQVGQAATGEAGGQRWASDFY